MPNRLAMQIVASALLLSCVDQPMISGVGSFQFAVTGADLVAGTAKVQVTVTAEFGFDRPVVVTLTNPPSGLTADPLTVPAGAASAELTLHAQAGLVLDQPVTVTGTAGDLVQTAPIWLTSGFDGGSLDASFGDRGIAAVSANAGCGGLAILSDGAILVGLRRPAAAGGLARVTAAGQLDAAFGQSGVTALAGTAGGPHQVTVVDGGSVFAAGDEIADGRTHGRLWKVDGHGAPDASFGTGGYAEPIASGTYQILTAGGQTYLFATPGGSSGFMVRSQTNGSLDPEFGDGGRVFLSFIGSAAALADGSGWLVAGAAGGNFTDGKLRGRLAVVTVDGDEDPPVDDPGDVLSAYSSPLVGSSGMYAVYTQFTASGTQTGFVQKLRADLTPDPSFASTADLDSVIQLVAVQADGKLLVVKNPGSKLLDHVVRLNPDGTVDPTVRIAIGKLVAGRLPDGARLTCGPILDAQGRLVFGYEGSSMSTSGTIDLVRVHL